MNYYIEKDGNIVLYDNNKQQLLNTLPFFPGYEGIEVQETEREIIRRNGGFVFADEVAQELLQEAKEAKIEELKLKLEELDKQRIRALCEPSNRTDNQTWLEYYNEQIIHIRKEIQSLQN